MLRTRKIAVLAMAADCSQVANNGRPSDVLVDVQQAVPGIFSDAKYAECYRKGFNSFARFSLPIFLDKDRDNKLASESHVNLVSNDEGLLSVSVPKSVKAKLAAAQKKSPVGALDLSFAIKVRNDTGKDFSFSAIGVFVDQKPHVFSTLTAKAGGTFVVVLSDVSAKAAVENGYAMVLRHKLD